MSPPLVIFEWLPDDLSVRTIYLVCAVVGGAILAIQMILLLFGADMDADTDVDDISDHGDGFGFMSIRSMAGFLTFFGLTGMWGHAEQWGAGRTFGIAFGAGLAAFLLVAWVMSLMSNLYSEGNVKPENAVGSTARVYLRIPSAQSGKGKITVSIQGNSLQYEALTEGPELPTGSEVRILRMTTPGTFMVAALDAPPPENTDVETPA